MKRIDKKGPDTLSQQHEPMNKFPDFVRYIVQHLKTLDLSMGKIPDNLLEQDIKIGSARGDCDVRN